MKENVFDKLISTAFGERVKQRRIELDITQEKLAEKLAVDPNFIKNIESGKRLVSLPNFYALCIILDTSANYLLYGDAYREDNLISESRRQYKKAGEETRHDILTAANTTGGAYGYGGELERQKLLSWILSDSDELDTERLRIMAAAVYSLKKDLLHEK